MKKLIALVALSISALAPLPAHAWFFFFIPGSVTGKISDALSGAEGDSCVGPNAKVGDVIKSPTGNTATVKSLSGTSSRCRNPELPIRALLTFNYSFSSKAGMNIPEGFESKPVSEMQRFQGFLLRAENPLTKAGFAVSALPRTATVDAASVATKVEAHMKTLIDDAKTSAEEELTIKGLRALRFEMEGKNKGLFGGTFIYVVTLLEGSTEVLVVNAWAPTKADFSKEREELQRLALSVDGLAAPSPALIPNPTYTASPAPAASSPTGEVLPSALAAQPAKAPSTEPNQSKPAGHIDAGGEAKEREVAATAAQQPISQRSAPVSPAAQKLRELNQLLKDGVITPGDYEAKKQEILKAF
jgi:hypothetical protein